MVLSIKLGTRQLIDKKLRAGSYDSADALIKAGLAALTQQEQCADFAPDELRQLLNEGEKSLRNGGVPASRVFSDLRSRSQSRRRARKAG